MNATTAYRLNIQAGHQLHKNMRQAYPNASLEQARQWLAIGTKPWLAEGRLLEGKALG